MTGFLVENNDAGGTNGTTISHANSGGASGSAWDTVTIGAGSTVTYDNAWAHGAGQTLSSKFVVPAGITSYHFWNLTTLTGGGGSTTQLNTRHYIKPVIGIKHQIHKCLATVSNTFVGGIYIDATGHVLIEDSSFAVKQTSTTVLVTGSVYRLEYKWVFDASAGIIEVKIFTNPDSLTPAETLTQTGLNTSTAFNTCHWGVVNAGASSITSNQTGFGASNQGAYIGPKAYSSATTGVAAAATVAGTAGTVKVGTGVHISGVAAAVTAAGTAGVAKAGAKVAGHGAAVTVAGTAGVVKAGAKVHGVAAAITVAGTPGAVIIGGAAIVLGHGAAVTVAGGVGQVKTGVKIHGVSAAVSVQGTAGHPKAGARVIGVAASVSVVAGIGHVKAGVKIHGVAATVTVAGGIGRHPIGVSIHGVAALVDVSGTAGFPDVPNVAATVTGVSAHVTVAGTPGHVKAGAKITGVHAGVVVAGGVGTPRHTAGHSNPASILDSVKKAIGFDPETENFDPDIMVYINAALSTLALTGVVPTSPLRVTSRTDLWSSVWPYSSQLGMIQNFVFLSVKLAFDPPGNGFGIKLIEDQILKLRWRINVAAEAVDA